MLFQNRKTKTRMNNHNPYYIKSSRNVRSSHQRCFVKKMFFEISQNSQENTCVRVSIKKVFIKKETLAQVFSCEFCEISKNTFVIEHFWWLLLKCVQNILTWYYEMCSQETRSKKKLRQARI